MVEEKKLPFGVKLVAVFFFLLALLNISSLSFSLSNPDPWDFSPIFVFPLLIIDLIIGILLLKTKKSGRILGAAYSGFSFIYISLLIVTSLSSGAGDIAILAFSPPLLWNYPSVYSFVFVVLKLIVYGFVFGYLLFNKRVKEAFEGQA